jgi:hypothetical protein
MTLDDLKRMPSWRRILRRNEGASESPSTIGSELTLPDVLDHSWNWFEMHASQRMQLINYFLIAVAFLSAAYAAGLRDGHPEVSAAVSALGLVLSFCFRRIETRTRDLIKIGEEAIAEIETIMNSQFRVSSIELVRRASDRRRRFAPYAFVILVLHYATLVVFAIGLMYALYRYF